MPRPKVMPNLVNKDNLALVFTRSMSPGRPFNHVFCVQHSMLGRFFTDAACITYFSPLYLYPNHRDKRSNLSPSFIAGFQKRTGLEIVDSTHVVPIFPDEPTLHLPPDLGMFQEYHGLFNEAGGATNSEVADPAKVCGAKDVFHYVYAVFHSPTYRGHYAEFLKMDFPRLPLTSDVPLFRALSALGEQLTALHLMERTGPDPAAFPVAGSNSVDAAPKYDEGTRRVSINKTQYFAPVPPEVWAFQIGGYQVCHNWLKDRKGRMLTEEDITHYGSIVAALGETIRLMADIDAVIEEHGGWPLAGSNNGSI